MENLSIEYFNGIVFEDKDVQNSIQAMQQCLERKLKNDFDFLCILQNIRWSVASTKCSTDNLVNATAIYQCSNARHYIHFYEIFEKYFHLKQKTVRNYLSVAYKFLVESESPAGENSLKFKFKYKFDICKYLTISKMQELLPLSDSQIISAFADKLTFNSSKEQIRAYVKSIKGGTNAENKVLETNNEEQEEIPMAYNPKKHYEFSYFEDKTKAQLLNIVWQLQTEFEKYKEEMKKSNKKK